MVFPRFKVSHRVQAGTTDSGPRTRPGTRVLVMLVIPAMLMFAAIGLVRPDIIRAGAPAGAAPSIIPPTNLQLLPLDSSIHVTWTPSTDPAAAWQVVSVYDGSMQEQAKVVGRTSGAAQTNGLVPDHTYTVRVQAMDAQGNLSAPVEATTTTDRQSPMRNAAFFENFNGPAGDLDSNYFDVRTSHGANLQPESIGPEKMLVFNNENHFHTQMIGGVERGELYIRPRVPFDFANRTGTLQVEVDNPPVMHSPGKWFEFHLVKNIPWSSEEFGAGNGEQYPDSVEFSLREGDGPNPNVNLALITVNVGGTVTRYQGTVRQMTPSNVRVPVVLHISQTSAELVVNGVSVVQASGFNLPFTQGYWMLAHRAWYAPRDTQVSPVVLQLIHWETIQYDGPNGSFNPLVRTYIEPGCPGVVHNEHDGVMGCQKISLGGAQGSTSMNFSILDDSTTAHSARLLYNGTAEAGALVASVNGHTFNVPTQICCYQNTLNTASFPANWLRDGSNTLTLSVASGGAEISQFEVEVVYDQHRVMPDPAPVHDMPMINLTSQSFRFDHVQGDPTVVTGTTYLYNMGSTPSVNWTASVISSESPWLTISPTQGTVTSPAQGGGVTPITFSIDFTNIPVDADGQVGVVKILGGNMPLYLAILAVNDGAGPRPVFLPAFTGLTTTFDKSAIPDYHGANGTPTPAPPTLTPGGPPTATPVGCSTSFTDVPSDYWAYQYIHYMACNGIVSGYSDGTFRPGNVSTRGQIAKIVVLGEGWTIDTTGGPHFSDVQPGSAFYEYVETTFNHGAISGYADGTFRWGNNVTRAQLSKIIVNAQNWAIDTSGGPHFSDVQLTDTFYPYIETAFNHGIISGYTDGTFRPGYNATRAQLSKILYLALSNPHGVSQP